MGSPAATSELALRGLLGEQTPLSASTVADERTLAGGVQRAAAAPDRRRDRVPVVERRVPESGAGKGKYSVAGGHRSKPDGRKAVLAVTSGYRESTTSWSALLRDLHARGMNEPRLVVGDGNLRLWSALRNIFPEAQEQRSWNHRLVTPFYAGAQAAPRRSARAPDHDPVSGQRAPGTAKEAGVSETGVLSPAMSDPPS